MTALLSLYRSFSRHPRFALINLGGLALGIAVFLILFLYVRFETSFDRVQPGADEVWVIDRKLQFGDADPVVIPSRTEMLDLLKADYPGTQGTRLLMADVAIQSRGRAVKEEIGLADPAYFEIFPMPVASGNVASALARPDGAVLTQSAARRHLRPGEQLGQTFTALIGTEERPLRVAAIIADQPAAMTDRPQILARLLPGQETFFEGGKGLKTLLRFETESAAAQMNRDLPGFTERHPDPNFEGPEEFIKVTEKIVPLSSLHLAEPRDRLVVTTLGILGLIALGLAIVNYVNLATARGDLRAREVALRKVVGAPRSALIRQFLGESLAAAAISGVLGLALAEAALPFVNAAGGLELELVYLGKGGILLPLVAVVVLTGLVAGLYPAFALSRFQPAAVLSSNRSPGTGRRGALLRGALVVGQFAIAIALMICTAILFAQARHVQNADPGYERNGLITVTSLANPNLDPAQRTAIRRAISALPGVTGTATSAVIPTGGSFSIRKSSGGEVPVEIDLLEGDVGRDFTQVYGVRLLAGRLFDASQFPADISKPTSYDEAGRNMSGSFNILVNRSAASALGYTDPNDAIGETLRIGDELSIIGVIEDMNFVDPTQLVQPFAYYLREDGDFTPRLSVRHTGEPRAMLRKIEAAWQQRAGSIPFEGFSARDRIYETYLENDVQRSRLFAFGTVLAVLVGALGLYGLAAFNTSRRVREVGIRKSEGASSGAVTKLLVLQFLRPVLLANLIAWPLAWWAMSEWLSGFSERVALHPVYFIAASLLALVIAVMTVLAQALRASRTAPAEALRHV